MIHAAIESLARAKVETDPFLHAWVDDFLPQSFAAALATEFPSLDGIDWDLRHNSPEAREKVVCSTDSKFPPLIREALDTFHNNHFINALRKTMGVIEDLVVDPTHRGCGMHSTGPRGHVGIHSDSSRHPDRSLDQLLNLILWLNDDWPDEYGGHLELWDRDAKSCRTKFAPILNRLVIFETGTTCYHGHPYKLTCPVDRRRNSLAVYYYQAARATDDQHDGWREAPTFVTLDPI